MGGSELGITQGYVAGYVAHCRAGAWVPCPTTTALEIPVPHLKAAFCPAARGQKTMEVVGRDGELPAVPGWFCVHPPEVATRLRDSNERKSPSDSL